jgi:prepilin-type N-terminal cleavage/methylation domain-containing protein
MPTMMPESGAPNTHCRGLLADGENVVRRRSEGGFTLVEVIVTLGLISTLMAALGAFFTSSMQAGRGQSQIQAATRLAEAGMEQARGYGGAALLFGRAQCGTCLNVSGYDAGYLSDTVRWDAKVAGATPTVRYDDQPETFTVNGVTYYRYWFVGKCWQAATGGLCTTTSTLPVAMVRLVVGVIWAGSHCANSLCVQAATALFSADPADPVFP